MHETPITAITMEFSDSEPLNAKNTQKHPAPHNPAILAYKWFG